MNNPNNVSLTATEWSRQYVQEWLREGETELWAGQSKRLKGSPVITVVHCAGFDGAPPCIEVRIGKRVHTSTMATRNWQHERRVAIRIGMELAGKSGNAAEIDAALEAVKARQPSVTQQVAELARLIADSIGVREWLLGAGRVHRPGQNDGLDSEQPGAASPPRRLGR